MARTFIIRPFGKKKNSAGNVIDFDRTQKDLIDPALKEVELEGGTTGEIIDSVRYRAASARYKVYIIDEVHMLSNSAFNALLKTLEEPPEHVKFIFATTEIRKVPVTVLSRCQRFDFRNLSAKEIADHLKMIVATEKVSAEEDTEE